MDGDKKITEIKKISNKGIKGFFGGRIFDS